MKTQSDSSAKFRVEAWSNADKTWDVLRIFDSRREADACVKLWERDGYRARVLEARDESSVEAGRE